MKQTTVTITSMTGGSIKYYVQNGKIMKTDNASFQADAGSMCAAVFSGSRIGTPTVSGATQGASSNDSKAYFYLVDA